jgi:hypothetical protein
VGPYGQSCSCQKHFAQFHFNAFRNHTYDLNTTGVLEDTNRLSFPHPDPSFCVVVKIFFTRPNPVQVTLGSPTGAVIPRITTGVPPTTRDASPSGTNMMDPSTRQLYVKMCGGTSQTWWLTYQNDQVLVSATLQMTVDEFFGVAGPDTSPRAVLEIFVTNMATLLGIAPSQISVTCVHPVGEPACLPIGSRRRARRSAPGGIVVDMSITPANTTTSTTSTTSVVNGTNVTTTVNTSVPLTPAQQLAQLASVVSQLTSNSSSIISGMSSLPGNFTVASFEPNYAPSESVAATTTTTPGQEDEVATPSSSTSISAGVVAGAVVGAVLVLAIAGILLRRRASANKRKAPPAPFAGDIQNPTLTTFYTAGTTHGFEGHKAPAVAETDFSGYNPEFEPGADDEGPSYFSSRNRAELVQDSLMVRIPKARAEASQEMGPGEGYLETSPAVTVQVDPSAESHIRPSALQHTEEPEFKAIPMRSDGQLSFVRGSVTSRPPVKSVGEAFAGFDDEDGLPGTGF